MPVVIPMLIGGLARPSAARRPSLPPPKRKRGRPKKPEVSWWNVPPKPQDRRRKHDLDDQGLIQIVDDWKARAPSGSRGALYDASAIAELLYHHAPPDIRRALDVRRAHHARHAETNYTHQRALHRAVVDLEGPRFEWWVKRLDRARRNLRRA